jgi:hypothetical protein
MDIRIPYGPPQTPHHRVNYNDTVKFKFDETKAISP